MMNNPFRTIQALTSVGDLTIDSQKNLLNDFAETFGWKPSDYLIAKEVSDFAAPVHLVVEHGLENTAVLSFLQTPYSYLNLNIINRTKLLSLSYNNLVDWHIPIAANEVATVFNRMDIAQNLGMVNNYNISENNLNLLHSDYFDKITNKRPNPNLPALDNALIDTISSWKRRIAAEFDNNISNQALSALFNAIIFARAVEDHQRRKSSNDSIGGKYLLNYLKESNIHKHVSIREILKSAILQLINKREIPDYLIDYQQLSIFDSLSPETVYELLSSFYKWHGIPYSYDFSVMSKHALSRIYEHYVSILRTVEEPPMLQTPLFENTLLPKEEKNKSYGSVYTPQFIARFFAKFIRNQMLPSKFLKAKVSDPACGSGMFLRTLLELRFETSFSGISSQIIEESFNNILGIDLDPNATQATQLSLALLFLVLTDNFPQKLNVFSSEAIEYFQNNPALKNSQDVVIANPPFIPVDLQLPAIKERIQILMGDKYGKGRIDSYLPFLLIALEMLKPEGFGLFVLPASFLRANYAKQIRKLLSDKAWILCLADLSAIDVFEDSRSYPILLVFQKKSEKVFPPPATLVKCQEFVGRALQDALDQRFHEETFYSIYEVNQDVFKDEEWSISSPSEISLNQKFKELPKLEEFFQVRQGFVSGADNVFIVPEKQIPKEEKSIYIPYLPDREMRSYVVPSNTSRYFFYPYIEGRYITEAEMKKLFPKTWAYLESKEDVLIKRKAVINGQLLWWRPTRPRSPENMMRPKIIVPHLVLVPRFGLDLKGKYGISRSLLLYPKNEEAGQDLLVFFAAILNSRPCYWHIANNSSKYQKGYSVLEVKTLRNTPVPNLSDVSISLKQKVINLVNERLISTGAKAIDIEQEIDQIAVELYQLTPSEQHLIGM